MNNLYKSDRTSLRDRQRLKKVTETELKDLAGKLAKQYKGQDLAIGLSGPLGAGKTTFTKSFAGALGIKRVKSPTFIVVSEYPLGKQKFYHIDLYRLNLLDELQTLGLTDLLRMPNRIVLIEWIDKFPKIAKLCDIIINLKISDKNTRHVQIINHKN